MAYRTNAELSDTRRQVRDLTIEGVTPRDIAKQLDISTQRVYQHLKKLGLEPATERRRSGRGGLVSFKAPMETKVDGFLADHTECEVCHRPSRRVRLVEFLDRNRFKMFRLGAFCDDHGAANQGEETS